MSFPLLRSRAALVFLAVLTVPPIAAHAQQPQPVVSKLDALLAARVPLAALEGLSRNPFVVSISMDAIVIAEQAASGDSLRGTLGLSNGNHTGNRVGVAVIDSGLEAGPEFGDRIAGFYDFSQGGI